MRFKAILLLFLLVGSIAYAAQIPTKFIEDKAVTAAKMGSETATAGWVPKADGSGGVAYGAVTATPAGGNTQIQYSTGTGFGASSFFTWTTSANTLDVKGLIKLDGSSSGYVGLQSPASPTSYTLTFPGADSTGTGILSSNGSGILSWLGAATGSNNGYLSSSDWTSFNSKEPAISAGTTSQYWRGDKTWQNFNSAIDSHMVGTSPIDYSNGTYSMHVADSTHNGYLSSGDFSTFAGKGTGTVTSVTFTGDGTVLSSTPSSAVTTSGTVTATLNTQSAGKFLAGPTSGSAAAPTFRYLQGPTVQTFTSGSGTYTTHVGALYIRVYMVGGGGGGGGSGAGSPTAGNVGTASTASTFGTQLSAGGGLGGAVAQTPGNGGTATLGTGPIGDAINGYFGSSGFASVASASGGGGAASCRSSGGYGGIANGGSGAGGLTNSGAGGGGAAGSGAFGSAGGGGAGGCINAIISSPEATYNFTVGVAGSGGNAGTGGGAGGNGGSGYISVTEYYQ